MWLHPIYSGHRRWTFVVGFSIAFAALPAAAFHGDRGATIRSLAEFRAMPISEQSTPRPVFIEATITYVDPVYNWMFVADGDERLFVFGISHGKLEQGQRVAIDGQSAPGEVLPIVHARRVEVIADQAPMPAEKSIPRLAALTLGEFDSDWVEVEATVLYGQQFTNATTFIARNDDHLFFLRVAERMNTRAIAAFARARVRVRGVLGYRVEARPFHTPESSSSDRILSFEVFVQSSDQLLVDRAQLTAPHDFESQTIRSVLSRTRADPSFQVHGHVSFVDGDGFILEDETGGMRLVAPMAYHQIGREYIVQVLGVAREHAVVATALQPLSVAQLSRPNVQPIAAVLRDERTFTRVTVRGELISTGGEPDQFTLRDDDGHAIGVRVVMRDGEFSRATFADIRVAELTGVLEPTARGHQLLVSSHEDVVVIARRSSRWLRVLGFALGGAVVIFGLCLLWVWLLRRRVAERTAVLSAVTAQLRTCYDAMSDGIIALDPRQVIITANAAAQTLLDAQFPPGTELQLDDVIASLKPHGTQLAVEWAASRHDERYTSSFDLQVSQPRPRYLTVAIRPIVASKQPGSERYMGHLWLFRDQTRKRELERQLLQSQKMEAIGTMAGGLAHDFNNLLSAINISLELARTETMESERQEMIQTALDAAASGTALVKKLLGFARQSSFEPSVCDVADVVAQSFAFARQAMGAGFVITKRVEPDLPPIWADSVLLQQVILNLCVNARDAMPDGGEVSVRAVVDTSEDGHDNVVISVTDTGSGISPEIGDKIFEPFVTTKGPDKGTGLGLSVSFGVVQQHGGTLTFDSELGEGSVFKVSLPARPDLRKSVPRPGRVEPASATRTRVLVIDDELHALRALSQTLEASGYVVATAMDGASALDTLASMPVGAIVLDLMMPGMTGAETLMKIRQMQGHSDTPVILCSGHEPGTVVKELSNATIKKPFSSESLVDTVDRALTS